MKKIPIENASIIKNNNAEMNKKYENSNKKPETNFKNYHYDNKYEEDLRKAMAESIRVYEENKTHEEEYYEIFENSLENCNNHSRINKNYDIDIENEDNIHEWKDKKNIFEEYKQMIYENPMKGNAIDENSMFPLMEDDLSPTYLFLEKSSKK